MSAVATQIARVVITEEAAPFAVLTQMARVVIYNHTCDGEIPEPEPEVEVEDCPATFLEDTPPVRSLDRLMSVHGDGVVGRPATITPVCLTLTEDLTSNPLERFFRVHGYETLPRGEDADETFITSQELTGYSGVLGEMPLGELVLGGYGVEFTSADLSPDACLTFEEVGPPLSGFRR